jgi:hypothetical protein
MASHGGTGLDANPHVWTGAAGGRLFGSRPSAGVNNCIQVGSITVRTQGPGVLVPREIGRKPPGKRIDPASEGSADPSRMPEVAIQVLLI